MILLRTLFLLSSPLLWACATANGSFEPLGPDHPANPRAPELPISSASAILRDAPRVPAPAEETPPTSASFVCPMHPHIVSDVPGTCPECGMALVPSEREQEERSRED